jgi:hypothetical protein
MALPTASDNPFPSLLITEGTEPSAPAAGKQRLYIDSTTHSLKATNSSGTDRNIEGGVELDYVQKTTNTSVTATATGSADTVITGSSVAYDGTTIVMIEFYCPSVAPQQTADAICSILLFEDSTFLGYLAQIRTPSGSNAFLAQVHAAKRHTPSNASHAYTIKAITTSGTSTVSAGAGSGGTNMPAFIRITKV